MECAATIDFLSTHSILQESQEDYKTRMEEERNQKALVTQEIQEAEQQRVLEEQRVQEEQRKQNREQISFGFFCRFFWKTFPFF